MDRCKVLFIASSPRIGFTNSFLDLVQALQNRCCIEVLTWDKEQDPGLFDKMRMLNIKFIILPSLEGKGGISMIKSVSRIADLALENRYDVVHCNTQWQVILAAIARCILKLNRNVKVPKVVSTIHSFNTRQSIKRFIHRHFSQGVICLSEFSMNEVGIRHSSVCHWGVDDSLEDSHDELGDCLREKIGLNSKLFKVLVVANFTQNKGYDELIGIATALASQCHFIFLGSYGDMQPKVERLLRKNGVSHFLGRVQKEHMNAIYRSCDVFLSMSRSETFGLSLLEALYNRLPVVCTPVGIAPEVVVDSFNGYLVKDRFEAEERIRRLMVRGLENNMEAARQVIMNEYSWNKVSRSYFEVYTQTKEERYR